MCQTNSCSWPSATRSTRWRDRRVEREKEGERGGGGGTVEREEGGIATKTGGSDASAHVSLHILQCVFKALYMGWEEVLTEWIESNCFDFDCLFFLFLHRLKIPKSFVFAYFCDCSHSLVLTNNILCFESDFLSRHLEQASSQFSFLFSCCSEQLWSFPFSVLHKRQCSSECDAKKLKGCESGQ